MGVKLDEMAVLLKSVVRKVDEIDERTRSIEEKGLACSRSSVCGSGSGKKTGEACRSQSSTSPCPSLAEENIISDNEAQEDIADDGITSSPQTTSVGIQADNLNQDVVGRLTGESCCDAPEVRAPQSVVEGSRIQESTSVGIGVVRDGSNNIQSGHPSTPPNVSNSESSLDHSSSVNSEREHCPVSGTKRKLNIDERETSSGKKACHRTVSSSPPQSPPVRGLPSQPEGYTTSGRASPVAGITGVNNPVCADDSQSVASEEIEVDGIEMKRQRLIQGMRNV